MQGKGVTYIMVDVETDGPVPGLYSMIQLGAVVVEPGLKRTYYGEFKPLPGADFVNSALEVVGVTREETLQYQDFRKTVSEFYCWVEDVCNGTRPVFVSDNPGFDFAFVSWYMYYVLGKNPFGHSQVHLGSLYKGVERSMFKNFKHLRVTKHTHNPVDDAMGNAEAMLSFGRFVGGLPYERKTN